MQSYTPPAQPGEAKQVRSYAELPQKRLVRALLAVSFGTMLEWYDFTIYTQLAPVISKVFFPEENAAAQAMSVWGVFAVGFLARPAGALLFGHLGDTRGRGTCLLFSVLLMGVPTVIVGCLPTYAQAGIAAPILLALLRFIQGLAMGGEFGAAMVYLSEIALPEYKAVTGSLGYVSLGVGVTVGILVVAAVTGRTPAAAMMVWGWRVPFLLAIFTLVAATILRYNMPESSEFLVSKEEIDEEFHKRLRQQMLTQQTSSKRLSFRGSGRLSFRGSAQHPQTTDAAVTVPTITEDDSPLLKDLEAQALATKHYVPLVELFRGYWRGILVQIAYTAWVGAVFYWGNTWLPSFFVKHAGIPPQTTIWMVLTGIIAYTITVPIGGIMSDRGVGPVTGTAVAALISGATSVPFFLAFQTKSLVACWLLQTVILIFAGYAVSVTPKICTAIYPAGVRISGLNFAYNIGILAFGGVTPLVMTAIQTTTGSIFIGPGLWMTGMAVITFVACFFLVNCFPQTNATSRK